MSFIATIFAVIFPHPDAAVTVEARVENADFDLQQATQVNIATTKLLDDLLHRTVQS